MGYEWSNNSQEDKRNMINMQQLSGNKYGFGLQRP